jgi:hypothetical protein
MLVKPLTEFCELVNSRLAFFKLIDGLNIAVVLHIEELTKDERAKGCEEALPELELVLPEEVVN